MALSIGRAVEEGRLSLAFVARLFRRPVTMLGVSARELERELSLSPEFVDDVRIALGVPAAADEPIRGDDAEVLRLLERFVRQGLDERVAEEVAIRLSGYTRMTEEAGDETAADQVRRLADLVRRTSIQLGGRLVKMLGDGAMLHFADPSAAVRWGLEPVGEAAAARLPPARASA